MSKAAINNINQQFQYLDLLPDSLYQKVVTLHYGELEKRVAGIMAWRASLLSGKLPHAHEIDWPEEEIKNIVLRRIDGLDIIDDCKNQENLVDELLLALCDAIESVVRRRQQGIHNLFDDILDRPFKKRQKESDLSPEDDDFDNTPSPDSDSHSTPSNEQNTPSEAANATNGEAPQPQPINQQTTNTVFSSEEQQAFTSILEHSLDEIADSWHEIKNIFASMGVKPGRGWDLQQGELRTQSWQEIVKLRNLIKNHPQLISIVENLGRSMGSDASDSHQAPDDHTEDMQCSETEEEQINHDPMHIQGITRSDDLSRMLPSEAVLLGHPKLKILWHAKRAERALLCYQVEGVLSTHTPYIFDEITGTINSEQCNPHEESRGPIILCIDTSGSMKGNPEIIAKAVALEVIRLANKEQRPCYLYIFSGPQEISEINLEFSFSGLKNIIQFLQNSFHGGTEVIDIVSKITQKIADNKWQKADILLISDGLFQVDSAVQKKVDRLKKKYKLRMHGLLIDGWRTDAMKALCQPLHEFHLDDASAEYSD